MNVNTSQWYEIHLRLHRKRDAKVIRYVAEGVKTEYGDENAALGVIVRRVIKEDKRETG